MSKSPKKSKSLTRAGNRPATISAQQTIPYVRMLPDGICQLPGGVYTKTLEYEDITIPLRLPRIRRPFSEAGVRG